MKAPINGIQLGYEDHGTGTPVVLLHAFPLNRRMWEPQVEALANRVRVITVDLRGHGESDAPLWHFTLDHYADDVRALLAHLSVTQPVLVGLSMGGYVCFSYVRRYATEVRGLILADTRAPADTDEGRRGRFAMAQAAFTQGHQPVVDAMLPKLLSPASRERKPELVERVRGMIRSTPISGILVDCMAMAERPDSMGLLGTIRCPALVIVGDQDQATPPADARAIAEGIPSAQLAVIPDAAHLANLEQPESFTEAIRAFVGAIEKKD